MKKHKVENHEGYEFESVQAIDTTDNKLKEITLKFKTLKKQLPKICDTLKKTKRNKSFYKF